MSPPRRAAPLTQSQLGTTLRTSHTPPLSRSDLVLWHRAAVNQGALCPQLARADIRVQKVIWGLGPKLSLSRCPRSFAELNVMEYRIGTAASVRLDVEGLDHLAPLLGFFGDQFPEIVSRA